VTVPAVSAVFRPVRAGNAFEETVERLLQVVKLGVVAYGERLPPDGSCAPARVSRVTAARGDSRAPAGGVRRVTARPFAGRSSRTARKAPRQGDLERVAADMGERLADALT